MQVFACRRGTADDLLSVPHQEGQEGAGQQTPVMCVFINKRYM